MSGSTRAAFELPQPTGPLPVGTTRWVISDPGHEQPLGPAGGKREVAVIAYYPAASAAEGGPAPYLRAGEGETLPLFRGPEHAGERSAIAAVRTHARVDASPATDGAALPVVLFSHGFGGFPSAHAALLEDLASHGYVVLSVQHPYESAAVERGDGTVVSFLDDSGAPRPGMLAVFAEWQHEDEALARVTAAAADTAALAALRSYLEHLPRTDEVVARWTRDTRDALDGLATLPPSSIGGRLARVVDREHVAAIGHSMGGVVAAAFCAADVRCATGLNLDGSPQSGSLPIGAPRAIPFLMVYSGRAGRAGANDPLYRRAFRPYVRADVRGTLHLDFSDLSFWGGPLREHHALGELGAERAAAVTRELVLDYLDATLRQARVGLRAVGKGLAEVRLTEIPGS